MKITFSVPGVPKGKSRPRFRRIGKFVQTYQPKEDREREKAILAAYRDVAGNLGPYSGPVAITVEAVFSAPQSWSEKRKVSPGPKTSKPDLDNIVKSVLDSLNKAAFLDDSQVIRHEAFKRYGSNDETIVSIERIGATADMFAAVPTEG